MVLGQVVQLHAHSGGAVGVAFVVDADLAQLDFFVVSHVLPGRPQPLGQSAQPSSLFFGIAWHVALARVFVPVGLVLGLDEGAILGLDCVGRHDVTMGEQREGKERR